MILIECDAIHHGPFGMLTRDESTVRCWTLPQVRSVPQRNACRGGSRSEECVRGLPGHGPPPYHCALRAQRAGPAGCAAPLDIANKDPGQPCPQSLHQERGLRGCMAHGCMHELTVMTACFAFGSLCSSWEAHALRGSCRHLHAHDVHCKNLQSLPCMQL